VLNRLADFLELNFGGSLILFLPVLFAVSFIFSGFVDNIPFTATMIPVIKHLPNLNPSVFSDLHPVWWTLSLGVCFGGNLTPIGASANVVALSMLKKYKGKDISYGQFMRFALLPSAISFGTALVYIFLRYV